MNANLKTRMSNQDWMEIMVQGVCERLSFWVELLEDRDEAIAKTRESCCAGEAAWAEALKRMGW